MGEAGGCCDGRSKIVSKEFSGCFLIWRCGPQKMRVSKQRSGTARHERQGTHVDASDHVLQLLAAEVPIS